MPSIEEVLAQKRADDAAVEQQGTPQETAQQDTEDNRGFLNRAWDDVKETVANWATGAIQGINEMARAQRQQTEGLANGESYQQGQQNADYVTKAQQNVVRETLEPAIMPAALAVPGLGPVAGAMLAGDVYSGVKDKGAAQTARDFTYGQAVDFANQPDLGKQFHDRPVSTAASGVMSVLPLALIGRGLYDRITRIPKVDENGVPVKEETQTDKSANMDAALDNYRSEQESAPAADTISPDLSNKQYGDLAQQVSDNTGLPADWIWAQWSHESGGFNSELAREDNNFGGIKTDNPRPGIDPPAPDGGYYRHFDSPEEYADYFAKYIKLYDEDGVFRAKNIDEYAQALKNGGYFGDSVENYANGMKGALDSDGSVSSGEGLKMASQTGPSADEISSMNRNERQLAEDKTNADSADKDLSDIQGKAKEAWQMTKDEYEKANQEPAPVKIESTTKLLPDMEDNYLKPLDTYTETLYRETIPEGNLNSHSEKSVRGDNVNLKYDPDGRIPIKIIKKERDKDWSKNKTEFKIMPDGQAVYLTIQNVGRFTVGDFERTAFRAIDDYFSPLNKDEYIRMSPDKEDYKYLKNGTHKGSFNWKDNEPETGYDKKTDSYIPALSVGKKPELVGDYGFVVKGDSLGVGSDGEPLINPKTAKIVSKIMTRKQIINYYDKILQQKLKQLGLSNSDYISIRGGKKYINLDPYIPNKINEHKQIVEQALQKGKPVPAEVIKDYPDLAKQYGIEYSLSGNRGNSKEYSTSELLNKAHQAAMKEDYEAAYNYAKMAGDKGWETAFKALRDTNGGKEIPKPNLSGKVKGNYSDDTITKKDIIKRINDIFTTVRTGRIGQSGVEGFINHNTGIIRSRNYGDLNVLSHEIGHLIDAALGLRKNAAAFDPEFEKVVYDRFGKNAYEPDQVRAEGIAEFMKDYVSDKEKAKQNFPKYYSAFKDALSKNPDIQARVNEFKDMVQTWQNQSPEARGRSGVSFSYDNKEFIINKAREAAYRAYEAFFDDKVELSRLTSSIEKAIGRKLTFEENPYKKARLAQNSALARAEMLVTDNNPELVQATLNKIYDNKIKYAVTMRDIFNGLNNRVLNAKYPDYLKNGNFKNWHEAFSTLLIAKRQIELQKINPKYKGPMSPDDAVAIVKNAPKELLDLTEKAYQYNDNLISIAVNGGLISEKTAAALRDKYKNYAPMARDFSDEADIENAFNPGKKIGNIGNPLKKLTEEGSDRSTVDPLENMVKNTYTLLNAVERNKVAQTFVDLSKNNGIGEFIERVAGNTGDSKKSIFTVMVDGEKQAYQTTPEFYRSIMSMNQATSSMLVSVMRPFAQVLRVGATISPDFIVRNLIRDTLTAGIYSETGFKPVLDSAKGVYSLIKDKPLAYEFKASGAPLSALVGLDRSSMSGVLDKLAGGNEWSKVNPVTYVKAAYEGMRKASETAESGTRIGEFKRARKQGKSIDEAGLLAKDITLDFSRSGTITRQINQSIPFFNAVLQGGDRLVRSFKDNPWRTLGFVSTYITLPSIALWVANHDEDWYKELSDDIKNGSWVFNYNGTIIRIPKPFEPGIIFGSAIERALDKAYDQDPDAVSQWAKYAAQGFAPGIIPAVAGPIIEWVTNYNMFTGKPVVGRKEQGLPDAMQYNAYTSELAKSIGKATNLSPEKIDNTINGYTASAGKFLVGMLDPIFGNKKELPAKTTSELPGIRGLTYTPFKNPQSVETFYKNMEEAEKDYAADGKKGHPTAEISNMRKYEKQISELNKDNRNITDDNKLTPDEKRQKIDQNNAKILDISKKANEKYPRQ